VEATKEKHVLFKHRNFLYLFLGKFISAVGDKVFTIALSVWIISSDSDDAKLHLGLLLAMNTIPIILFGPLAGTISDRFSKKTCMLVADTARFLILTTTYVLLTNDLLGITQMYFISCFLATFVPLFESAANSSVSHLVSTKDLPKAVATDASVNSLSVVIGASLGSIMVATIHFEGALIFNSITFLLSFIFISLIRTNLVFEKEHASYFKEIKAGFHYVFKNRALFMLMLTFGFVNLFTASIFILVPFLVQYEFNLPTAQWIGIYEATFAVGTAVTAIAFSFINAHTRIYMKMSLALGLFGMSYLLIGVTSQHLISILYFLMAGSALAVINTLAIGLFQQTVEDSMKGRFFAILGSIVLSVIPISYIVTGYISAFFSAATLFIAYGMTIVIISFILFIIPRIQDEIGN